VLTATQVTVWSAYRAVGQQPFADNAGALFAEQTGPARAGSDPSA